MSAGGLLSEAGVVPSRGRVSTAGAGGLATAGGRLPGESLAGAALGGWPGFGGVGSNSLGRGASSLSDGSWLCGAEVVLLSSGRVSMGSSVPVGVSWAGGPAGAGGPAAAGGAGLVVGWLAGAALDGWLRVGEGVSNSLSRGGASLLADPRLPGAAEFGLPSSGPVSMGGSGMEPFWSSVPLAPSWAGRKEECSSRVLKARRNPFLMGPVLEIQLAETQRRWCERAWRASPVGRAGLTSRLDRPLLISSRSAGSFTQQGCSSAEGAAGCRSNLN